MMFHTGFLRETKSTVCYVPPTGQEWEPLEDSEFSTPLRPASSMRIAAPLDWSFLNIEMERLEHMSNFLHTKRLESESNSGLLPASGSEETSCDSTSQNSPSRLCSMCQRRASLPANRCYATNAPLYSTSKRGSAKGWPRRKQQRKSQHSHRHERKRYFRLCTE